MVLEEGVPGWYLMGYFVLTMRQDEQFEGSELLYVMKRCNYKLF